MGSDSARQNHAASPSPVETVFSSLDILANAAAVAENSSVTRSGRVSKPPVRYEPIEKVEDDYDEDDYDTENPDGGDSEDIETDTDDEETDESDADENGNLDGFVVSDKSESDDEDNGESPVSKTTKRNPVKKRPAPSTRK